MVTAFGEVLRQLSIAVCAAAGNDVTAAKVAVAWVLYERCTENGVLYPHRVLAVCEEISQLASPYVQQLLGVMDSRDPRMRECLFTVADVFAGWAEVRAPGATGVIKRGDDVPPGALLVAEIGQLTFIQRAVPVEQVVERFLESGRTACVEAMIASGEPLVIEHSPAPAGNAMHLSVAADGPADAFAFAPGMTMVADDQEIGLLISKTEHRPVPSVMLRYDGVAEMPCTVTVDEQRWSEVEELHQRALESNDKEQIMCATARAVREHLTWLHDAVARAEQVSDAYALAKLLGMLKSVRHQCS